MPYYHLPVERIFTPDYEIGELWMKQYGVNIDYSQLRAEHLKIYDEFESLPDGVRTPRKYFEMSFSMIQEKFPSLYNYYNDKTKKSTEEVKNYLIRSVELMQPKVTNYIYSKKVSSVPSQTSVNNYVQTISGKKLPDKIEIPEAVKMDCIKNIEKGKTEKLEILAPAINWMNSTYGSAPVPRIEIALSTVLHSAKVQMLFSKYGKKNPFTSLVKIYPTIRGK